MFFYPKWDKGGSEASIGWDVAGYYLYLPATFIYKDLKQLEFQFDILNSYQPTPELQQSFKHEKSGNYVMKYSMGQAVQFLPFFTIAHIYASSSSKWKADGYSRPYQFMIALGSLLIALFGLYIIRKYLLFFFSDKIIAASIILLCLGSNYLEYAGITGAMTHNGLFTLYACLLYVSHRYYQSSQMKWALLIGAIIGLMGLTRPTELLAAFIPLTYGLNVVNKESLLERFSLFLNQKKHFLLAILLCGCIGSLQLIYWKYVSGDWIVYSYQEQGFSWLSPHIWDGLLSYRSGWLTYSPIMIFSLNGMFFIKERNGIKFGFSILFCWLFIYVSFAWDIWWYGGSLGQRTMVQSYPIFFIPFTFFVSKFYNSKNWLQLIIIAIATVFLYFNLWLTYQAHKGKMLLAGQMTKAYFWKTAGRWNYNREDLKLLDNNEAFYGEVDDMSIESVSHYSSTSENDKCYQDQIVKLDKNCQFSNEIFYKDLPLDKKWIRASADFQIQEQEWNYWLNTQMLIRYYNENGEIIKTNVIRPARLLDIGKEKHIHMDSKIPHQYDYLGLMFWNAGSEKEITIKNVKLEVF